MTTLTLCSGSRFKAEKVSHGGGYIVLLALVTVKCFFPYNTSSIIIMLKMTSNKNETKWDKEYFSMQLDLYKSKQNEKDSVALLTVPIPQIWPRRQSRVRQNDA